MTNPMVPDKYKKVLETDVSIERHVIIGCNSVVLPGIVLKQGSAFGSFSLIDSNSEEWSINVGIPCKKIKARNKNLLELEKKFLSDNQRDERYEL